MPEPAQGLGEAAKHISTGLSGHNSPGCSGNASCWLETRQKQRRSPSWLFALSCSGTFATSELLPLRCQRQPGQRQQQLLYPSWHRRHQHPP